jgi:proteasome lid subunit RPN8/RPN11
VRVPRAQAQAIMEHALAGYPFEVCGVLLGRNGEGEAVRVERVVKVLNREEEMPRVRYQIAPEDLIRIEREARQAGLAILGYYHSHPDHPARPSETDRRMAADSLSDGVIHVVVGVDRGERAEPTAWVFRDALQAFEPQEFDVE